jgi:peptide/nickel transport system substrate-binding protein
MTSRDGFEVVNALCREEVTRRSVLRALGWSAVAAAGVAPAAWAAPAWAQKPKTGGTIKVGVDENIDTLDPHNTTSIVACSIHNNIYNGLLKTTYDGKSVEFKPELAREWEIQGDRVHVFRLHKGVTFHNGEPCTAAEVKWNLERVKDKQQAPIHAWKLELLEAVDTPDSHTVKLTFRKPFPFLRVALTGSTGRAGTIVSPKAVKELGKAFGRKPVGTGPFKFVEWKEGDSILLEKNPNYWETDAAGGKLPYLDRVLIRIIIEPSTLVAALQTGEVDGVANVSPQFMAQVRADAKLAAYTVTGGNWRCVHFNLTREPFSDFALRKAAALAIDRKEIVDKVQFGEAVVAHGPISPPMTGFFDPAFSSGKNGQYYDLEAAQAYLARSKHKGGVEALLIAPNTSTYPRTAEAIQAQLAKINIKVKIEASDFPTWRRKWLQERAFDMVLLQWDADLDPDETIFPELHSKETWNAGRWNNPEFDRLVEAARQEADQKKRKSFYDQAVKLIAEDAPVAAIFHANEQKVFHKYVKGFQVVPANLINMHGVWLDKA